MRVCVWPKKSYVYFYILTSRVVSSVIMRYFVFYCPPRKSCNSPAVDRWPDWQILLNYFFLAIAVVICVNIIATVSQINLLYLFEDPQCNNQ